MEKTLMQEMISSQNACKQFYKNNPVAAVIVNIIALLTAYIGYNGYCGVGHKNLFYAFMDWLFWPFIWLKWLCYDEMNITYIKNCFSFFLQ